MEWHCFAKGLLRLSLCAVLASICPGEGSAAPARLAHVRIEVPSATNLQFLALWVAVGSGAFEKQGLQPKILVAAAPRTVGDMLLRGDADVALLPPPMFLGMMAEDKPIRLFASLLANEPINLVLQKDMAEMRNFPSNGSLREKLSTLKGLKVGLAGEVAPRLRALFAAAGLDAEKQLTLVTIAGPQQTKAFATRKVDLLFAHTPYLEQAMVEHGAVLVVNASNGEIPTLADGQIHALATTRATIRQNPQLIEKVTRAIYEAEQLIHSDSKSALDALMASGASQSDRRLIGAILAVYAPAVPGTPKISVAGIERDRVLYPAHPRAPDFATVRAADFVSSQFAEAAVAVQH